MKWFRFYHEVYRDPKVQDLRPELFRFWVNFLCVASDSEPRGVIASESHLKRALGLTAATVKRYVSDCEGAGLLHVSITGSLVPHNWDCRQPDGDDAAKRKREQRAKTYVDSPKDMSRDMSRDESQDKNVTIFIPPVCAPDPDTEKEKKRINTPRAPRTGGTLVDFILPSWVPENDWNDWLAMRKAKRAPTTVGAMNKAIKDLDALRAAGQSPGDVLQNATLRAWTGIFPIPVPYSSGTASSSSGPAPMSKSDVDAEVEKYERRARENGWKNAKAT